LKTGFTVQGLTTAATLWVSAAVGMGAAANFWFGSLITTIFVLFVLEVVKRLEYLYWTRKNTHYIKVENIPESSISKIISLLTENHVLIRKIIRTARDTERNLSTIVFQVQLPKSLTSSPLLMVNIVRGVEGVAQADVVLVDEQCVNEWMSEVSDHIYETDATANFELLYETSKRGGGLIKDATINGVSRSADSVWSSKFVEDSKGIAQRHSQHDDHGHTGPKTSSHHLRCRLFHKRHKFEIEDQSTEPETKDKSKKKRSKSKPHCIV